MHPTYIIQVMFVNGTWKEIGWRASTPSSAADLKAHGQALKNQSPENRYRYCVMNAEGGLDPLYEFEDDSITPENAPVGTVVVLGHPNRGVSATKWEDGEWRYNGVDAPNTSVNYDDLHKAAHAVYIPGRTLL